MAPHISDEEREQAILYLIENIPEGTSEMLPFTSAIIIGPESCCSPELPGCISLLF